MNIESLPILENPIFLISILCGISYAIAGVIMYKFPPDSINYLYGYRTINSMENQEKWDFAQIYSSKVLIQAGILLILISFIGFLYQPDEITGLIIALSILIAVTIGIFLKVEIALKKKFNKK
ncbi:MAG: SdpI family protein [Flavobacteriaceae bacterium]|nr:SdpI family protein [Flavobacteriaceae bacterium]